MESREYKDEVFGHFARIGAAFGHAKRVEIVDVLAQGERSVESLAGQISASVANTSRHLQILASAGLVTRRVEGTSRVYRLQTPR
jgi:DNA-binding transcriptional ArsR family regulator